MCTENSKMQLQRCNGNFQKFQPIERTEGFTQIDNRIINGQVGELTPDARLLLITLLSLPNDWILYMAWLQKLIKCSSSRLRRAKKELVQKEFLEVDEIRQHGKKAYLYRVYELPKFIMIEQNQLVEFKRLNSNKSNQSKENNAQINKKDKKEKINKKDKKNKSNICKTNGFAEVESSLVKSKENSSSNLLAIEEQVHHVNNTNMNSCSSMNQLINMVTENDKQADIVPEQQTQQKRANKREKYEYLVHELIDKSNDIPKELKTLLKNHVTARFEKGIRTTPTMFKQLYADLIEECPTIDEQIKRVKIATSNGYPDFRLRKKDKYKKSNQPMLVNTDDSDDNSDENSYTYI